LKSDVTAEAGARRVPRTIVFGAILFALLGGGVYSFVSLSNANRWLRHTDEVRVRVALLAGTLLDAETGLRGYLFTGTDSFLAPYDQARARWQQQLDEVRRLTYDNPDQQARLHGLETLINEDFGGFSRSRAAAERDRAGREPLALLMEHKRTMDAARVLLAGMETEEARVDRLRERDATWRWGSTAALLIGGALAFAFAAARMTVRSRLAEIRSARAEEEQRLLQGVFAGIDDGITLLDRRGKLIFANAAAAHMLGFDSPAALMAAAASEIVARFEIVDEEGQPLPLERLPSRAVFNGSPSARTTIRYRTGRSGPWRWSILQAHPVFDADGNVIQAINVFRDATADREAEERRRFLLNAVDELNSSLDYERTLAAIARLAVPVLADWCGVDVVEDGRVKRLATTHVDPNKLAAAIALEKRYPPDPSSKTGVQEIVRTGEAQLIPLIPRQLLTAAARDAEHLRLIDELELRSFMGVPLTIGGRVLGAITFVMAESHRTYGPADLEFARALADRAAIAVENARLFREVEGARASISAQLLVEERRRREAEDQTRFAETFVGMLGHDLRNPLNAIIMTTRLLRRIAKAPNEMTAVERVASSARRMSNMVGQLLDLTRSRLAGGIPIDKVPTDLCTVASEVVDELRRAYPGRVVEWTGGTGVHARADRDRLAQVFSNLVGNALEHGAPDQPVTVGIRTTGSDVTVTVHNHGAPISSEQLSDLFEPFRGKVIRSERSKGLGLGLYISEQIIRAHGGRIEVASTPERGTTFSVVLPGTDGELVDSVQQQAVS
jgi:signal transduction histidine kinase/CHASE3 domain sensor protein